MSARVLLIDDLRAIGGDLSDTRERAQALRGLGVTVRPVAWGVMAARRASRADRSERAAHAVAPLADSREGRDELRRLAMAGRFDLLVIASSRQDAADHFGRMTPGTRRVWWPTGFAARGARWPWNGVTLKRDAGTDPPALPRGLAWTTCGTMPARRATQTLWDGDFALLPAPLARADVRPVLSAFAELADEWTGLDLVVLSAPDARVMTEAERLGVGMRVHCVGAAPRAAEWGWWQASAAAVVTESVDLAGGMVWRALACGCPLVAFGAARGELGAWLERAQLGPHTSSSSILADAWRAALHRGEHVRRRIERGRGLTASHGPAAVPLVDALAGITANTLRKAA